jgi:hypothetical protein
MYTQYNNHIIFKKKNKEKQSFKNEICDNLKTSRKLLVINRNVSMVALNINGLYVPIKGPKYQAVY